MASSSALEPAGGSARALLSAILAVLVLLPACGPAELENPTPAEIETLIREEYPEVLIDVVAVQRGDETLRAPARFGDSDVVLVLEAAEGEWALTGMEMGEQYYAIEEIEAIQETTRLLETVSDALSEYQAANGEFPQADDLVGLRELVPEHYPADAGFEDAWGSGLRYRLQEDAYTLTSDGPDGEPGTADDVIVIRR